jgi:multidrug efflux pump subunit AcrA (membrane-fusion protein)
MKSCAFIVIAGCLLTALSACSPAADAAVDIPSLITPVSVRDDTAVAERGTVQVINQRRSFARVLSEGLYYGETDLRFKEYLVTSGQQVEEGELLALLDTEQVENDIEAKERDIARLKKEQEFENRFAMIGIDRVRAEYVKMVREAGFDEAAIAEAEKKKDSIAGLELALTQQQERQGVLLAREEAALQELIDVLPKAELRAPFAGVISHMLELTPGQNVEAYNEIIFITDNENLFLEIVGDGPSLLQTARVTGSYQGQTFELERVPMTRVETLFYQTMRLPAPLRYSMPPEIEAAMPIGAFVDVKVYVSISEDTLRIPANTIYTSTDLGSYVNVLKNGTMEPIPVKIGLRNDSWVEILEGIEEGDVIYVKP